MRAKKSFRSGLQKGGGETLLRGKDFASKGERLRGRKSKRGKELSSFWKKRGPSYLGGDNPSYEGKKKKESPLKISEKAMFGRGEGGVDFLTVSRSFCHPARSTLKKREQ